MSAGVHFGLTPRFSSGEIGDDRPCPQVRHYTDGQINCLRALI